MIETTSSHNFTVGVASLLTNTIFPSIVEGLARRGITISIDDLNEMTKIPTVRQPTSMIPAVPTMSYGRTTTTTSSNRKVTITATPIPGQNCMYKFVRGENRDLFCGRATEAGKEYCNACLKNRKRLDTVGNSVTPPSHVGGIADIMKIPHFPGPKTTPQVTPSAPGELKVDIYDESRGFYIEPVHQFIVQEVEPATIIVIGRHDEVTSKIVPLTLQQQGIARGMGLVIPSETSNQPIVESKEPQVITSTVSAIPKGTRPNGIASIPTIPKIQSSIAQKNNTNAPPIPLITPLTTQADTSITCSPPQVNFST